ncbi:S1/P1 nuclease [Entophlyctis helioformis]|nr:S1/P1 nuclease [Entophlyctis helioformis]
MINVAAAAVFVLSSAPAALAWGGDAHQAVGLVAEQFLTAQGAAFVSNVLDGASLSSVTTWADQIKGQSKYAFSKVLHYVDFDDSPPAVCGYKESRDCTDGKCLIGAVANYTAIASCGARTPSKAAQADAVKFLAHFVGDVTQPLHASARDRGGNDADIRFDSRNTNLHAAWDTAIPVKRIQDFNGSLTDYVAFLVRRIKTGVYASQAPSWISSSSLTAVSRYGNSLAAIDWAVDSNKYDCTVVWPAYDANPDQNFGTNYYRQAFPVVDIQIAKGGYRLADWINRIAATCAPRRARR